MKRPVIFILFMMVIALPVVPVFAAELLGVKPVVAGTDPVVEILADIPMTYTYYKVPGQARAVVDIADADPEKIEPLIVVNKGAVSSVSVDKTQIAGMVVSRLIFNLVSDTEISVTASADRKKLTVTFSGGKPASGGSEKPAASPAESGPAPLASPVPAPVVASAAVHNEADTLGLDEPAAAPAKNETAAAPATATSRPATAPDGADPLGPHKRLATPEKSAPAAKAADTPAASAELPNIASAPTAPVKLEPVVPVTVSPRIHLTITAIKVESTHIDIKASGRLDDFAQLKLTKPNRLVIDVPGSTSSWSAKGIPVRRFGLAQVRVGRYPDHTRIVLDAGNSPFPDYEIKSTDTGLRINFK
jgi:type IV pilus assembly protein PilQ